MENDLGKTIVISLMITCVVITVAYFVYDYKINESIEMKLYGDCYDSCSIIYQGGTQSEKYLEIKCERECLGLLNKSVCVNDDAISGEVVQ